MSAVRQNECHPAGRVLSSSFPLTLTLPSGKTDDTNEGWLLVSWHQTHTHCFHCATLSLLPPGSHRRCSLRKRTHGDGQSQVSSDTGLVHSLHLLHTHESRGTEKISLSASSIATDNGEEDLTASEGSFLKKKKRRKKTENH